ncbi:HlyD family type I secretion periplasmic adaptor subunit [Herbaspirillum sp.]|jgi:hemolysin D|uniref:HlyD family type I secretion periplasmic adaptor subunit n=1 Tax=Herbaspirillum TaxID=963 RepID=UPI00258F85CA|nr:HlyD family type I secretion periplasmic adaptor subunit [Herbaspirillum sp.]
MSEAQCTHSVSTRVKEMHPFSTAAISLQARPPQFVARMISLTICLIALLVILYACLAHIDIVVSAQGRVIPSGRSKVIQPLESGVVNEILVRDGQKVRAGAVLLTLDQTTSNADRQRLQHELWETETDVARLEALLRGSVRLVHADDIPREIVESQQAILSSRLSEQRSRMASAEAEVARRQADYDAILSSVEQLRNSLPLVEKKHRMREELAQTGHIAETGLIETKLELINLRKELSVQQNRLKESEAARRAAVQQKAQTVAEFQARISSDRVEAIKKRSAIHQELIKAMQRSDLQVLRAPLDGVVQQLAVTTVGGVVTPAQALMSIVPENAALEVEAQINNRDIGHIRVGQRVIAKVETFDFTRYGFIEGEVQWVGTDAVLDPKQGPVYPVRIQLRDFKTPNAVHGKPGIIVAGMNVTADIKTDERRMMEYFLAPLLRYKEESMRER